MELTDDQIAKCRPYFESEFIRGSVRPIVNYKKNDEGLSLFRVTAHNMVHEVLCRHVLGMRQTKGIRAFFNAWLNDPGGIGDLVRNFVAVVEAETGKKIKF